MSEVRVTSPGRLAPELMARLEGGAQLTQPPPGWDVRIVYTANPCSKDAEVELREGVRGVGWTVRVTPRSRGSCDDVLAVWAVDLRTTRTLEPIEVEAR